MGLYCSIKTVPARCPWVFLNKSITCIQINNQDSIHIPSVLGPTALYPHFFTLDPTASSEPTSLKWLLQCSSHRRQHCYQQQQFSNFLSDCYTVSNILWISINYCLLLYSIILWGIIVISNLSFHILFASFFYKKNSHAGNHLVLKFVIHCIFKGSGPFLLWYKHTVRYSHLVFLHFHCSLFYQAFFVFLFLRFAFLQTFFS